MFSYFFLKNCPVIVFLLFLKISYLFCYYTAHFGMIIKTPRISERRNFCREYQNVVNFATIFFGANLAMLQS